MTDFDILQEQMITFGGVVVTTNDCSHDAVNQARQEDRLYVDENGFGFVWFESCEVAIEARPEKQTMCMRLQDKETEWINLAIIAAEQEYENITSSLTSDYEREHNKDLEKLLSWLDKLRRELEIREKMGE